VAVCEREAGIDPASVNDDRASTTLAAVTALLGSCQMQSFAKKVEKRDARVIEFDGSRDTVNGECG
jgi:hypothetical protein